MHDIILIFPGALALLFLARKIARRVGLVDKPNARKHHHGNIPLVGGVSIYFSLWLLYGLQPEWLPSFSVYMLCITLLLLVGIADDRFDLPVMPRIVLQSIVAAIMMWQGLSISSLGNIILGQPLILGGAGYLITLFAVIGSINAFNMVDGIDGLLGALASVAFATLSMLFFFGGRTELGMWCLALLAACAPYILLNLGVPWGRKFKVFMGDAGSMLIGFTVIWLLILASQGEDAVMAPVTALWVIALPLLDMTRVMICRIHRGSSPFRPDREHLHHILMRMGFSGRMTLAMMTSAQVLSGILGIILAGCHLAANWQFVIFCLIFILFLYAIRMVGRLKLKVDTCMTVE